MAGSMPTVRSLREFLSILPVVISLLFVASAAVAAPPPLKTTLVEQGYDFSIHVIAPPGDTRRLFVVERGGRIFLRKDGVRLKQPFLDLTELTGKGHGRILLQ